MALVTESRLVADALGLALQGARISVVAVGCNLDDVAAQLDVLATQPQVLIIQHSCAEPHAVPERLGRSAPSARLVVTSVPEDLPTVLEWAEAGAHGLMTHETGLEEFVAGIRLVASGQGSCPPAMTTVLLDCVRALRSARGLPPEMEPLTRREHQVARLLERGLSNKEIARQLDITVSTVKNHVHNILTKLDLTNRGRVRLSRLGEHRA